MFKFLFFILALLLVSFNAVSVSAHPLSQMRRADWTAVARRAPVDDLIVPKVVREIEAGPLKCVSYIFGILCFMTLVLTDRI